MTQEWPGEYYTSKFQKSFEDKFWNLFVRTKIATQNALFVQIEIFPPRMHHTRTKNSPPRMHRAQWARKGPPEVLKWIPNNKFILNFRVHPQAVKSDRSSYHLLLESFPIQRSRTLSSLKDNHLCLFKMERIGLIPLLQSTYSQLRSSCSLLLLKIPSKQKKVNGMGAIFVVVVGFTKGFKIHNNSLPSQKMGLDILYDSDTI